MIKEDIKELIGDIRANADLNKELLSLLIKALDLRENPFHPLVFINGSPKIGKGVFVGFFSEINAKDSNVEIGEDCDIASFVSINAADSHMKCLEFSEEISRGEILLEKNVFVGSHSFIGGNVHVGHHSVIACGTILINSGYIPPYSLVIGNPAQIKKGYYLDRKPDINKDLL